MKIHSKALSCSKSPTSARFMLAFKSSPSAAGAVASFDRPRNNFEA